MLLILGVFALLAQRGSEPAVLNQSTATQNSKSVIGIANVRLLALLMVAMGIIVGTVDIVSVAFAEQLDKPAAASLVLSAYAGGSCLAGLLFGTLKLQMPLHRLLLLGSLATAATTLPLLLAGSIATLAGAVLVAGLFFAPTMIVAMSLVERLVPEHQLTEGMTWLLAGLNVGVALGAAASGQVVDSWNAPAGFYVALCAAALLLLVALCAYQRLRANDQLSPAVA
ncbi:Major Facilitator Superfamily protein [compost metagenome]